MTVTRRLKLAAFYVPSMRNGEPGVTTEDRGNAILSTLPLSDLTAIELPLERQRRVALGATVTVTPPGGARDAASSRLHALHEHGDAPLVGAVGVGADAAGARAGASVLPADGPLIVGGDFNAWFGYRDAAFKELARRGAAGGVRRSARDVRADAPRSPAGAPPAGLARCR